MTRKEAEEFNKWIESKKDHRIEVLGGGLKLSPNSFDVELRLGHYTWEGEPYKSKIKDVDYWRLKIPLNI
jgi:hypothetical protein